jgi:hypothetical protein
MMPDNDACEQGYFVCRHCGTAGKAHEDHTCSCPYPDEGCPDHPQGFRPAPQLQQARRPCSLADCECKIPVDRRLPDAEPPHPAENTDNDAARLVRLRKMYDDATHRIAELERALYRQSRKTDDYRAKWQQTAIDRRRDLDEARAALGRVETLPAAWIEGYPPGQYASLAVLACVQDLHAALAAPPPSGNTDD